MDSVCVGLHALINAAVGAGWTGGHADSFRLGIIMWMSIGGQGPQFEAMICLPCNPSSDTISTSR
jgi:hypothetical protein